MSFFFMNNIRRVAASGSKMYISSYLNKNTLLILQHQNMKFLKYPLLFFMLGACTAPAIEANKNSPIDHRLSTAQTPSNQYISWKEHIIDDTELAGIDISGSDGLSIGDLDKDGYPDIVSVHESDTEYDGALEGTIRIAFGSAQPDQWELVTLAQGTETAAAEDVAIEDINGDGYLDIVAACELAHLIYFQNPGTNIRSSTWERIIPRSTQDRGSFIRVFIADLNQDGQVEIIAANKGGQLAGGGKDSTISELHPISYFEITGDPLKHASWQEQELIRVKIPINSHPIDIDQDGDIDIIAGSRGENRIILFENISTDTILFKQHAMDLERVAAATPGLSTIPSVNGFNMDFADLNTDNRLDIVLCEAIGKFPLSPYLVWLEQPADWSEKWKLHAIGNIQPDIIVGLVISDINSDGKEDVLVGSYSRGDRAKDGAVSLKDPMGRLAWFEQASTPQAPWIRQEISRRKRGMFDKFIALDWDQDGDMDFFSTRGNSVPYDGVFWLEQVRTKQPQKTFFQARTIDSEAVGL